MGTLHANGINVYYEVAGEGPTIVFLTGLGFASWSWFRNIPVLSCEFHTIAIDNRGAGRSGAPDEDYSIAGMAADVAAVLSHLGVVGATVVGLSMGGYIAQELALNHPELVGRLVLCSTSAGGADAVMASPETLDIMREESASDWSPEVMRKTLRLRFSAHCVAAEPGFVGEYMRLRGQNRPLRHGWERQFAACLAFSSGPRLRRVRMPTLVITGDDDAIVPSANGQILADKIAGAELVAIPTGRHLAIIEFADQFNQLLADFCRP